MAIYSRVGRKEKRATIIKKEWMYFFHNKKQKSLGLLNLERRRDVLQVFSVRKAVDKVKAEQLRNLAVPGVGAPEFRGVLVKSRQKKILCKVQAAPRMLYGQAGPAPLNKTSLLHHPISLTFYYFFPSLCNYWPKQIHCWLRLFSLGRRESKSSPGFNSFPSPEKFALFLSGTSASIMELTLKKS